MTLNKKTLDMALTLFEREKIALDKKSKWTEYIELEIVEEGIKELNQLKAEL